MGKAQELLFANGGSEPASNGARNFVHSLNPAVQSLERMAAHIAPTDIPVFLVGESGSGKEVFALLIHQLSSRRQADLVKINCTSLPAESLHSLLREEEAAGGGNGFRKSGSILFDEVGELDADCQNQLLRALADGDGSLRPISHAARKLFSTSCNLEGEVQAGRFRPDLYHRIDCVCLRLPPLRQRKEDIPTLVDFFLTKYSAQFGRLRPTISGQTLKAMLEYSWPGNIRQLEDAVRRIAAFGEDQAILSELGGSEGSAAAAPEATNRLSLKMAARAASRDAERELILTTLTRTRWNRKRAARELQISYKSLLYKLKHIGLDSSDASKPGVLK